MKMVLVFLMLFQCHEESAPFIVLLLLNTIFKHHLQRLLNSLEFFSMYENYCKVVKGVRECFELFSTLWQGYQNFLKDRVGSTKTFCQMLPGLKNCFNSSKILSALVPGIKNDYSLMISFLRAITIPTGNYMFKVDNGNTRTRCEICLKLTIKTPERR